MITFRVYGEPKAQPRVRAFARKMGNGKFAARVYDPGTAEAWKSQIAIAAKPFLPSEPITGPIALRLEFYIPRPKSHMGKNGVKPSSPSHHVSKPDLDNLEKAVKDALTQINMWGDDCQVTKIGKKKEYATKENPPGVLITIKQLQ